jgi:hypothetical protein
MVERGVVTVEKSIYVIGLVVTIAVAVLSAGGMLRAIMRAKSA